MLTIISSANSETVTSLPICIHLISFSCLIALARTSSTVLNNYWESGQLCIAPSFSGISLSISLFSLMLAVVSLYIAFLMYRYVPCFHALSNTFIMKGCCILSKAFSTSSEMIMCFFFLFKFVNIVDYIDRFSYVTPSLHL